MNKNIVIKSLRELIVNSQKEIVRLEHDIEDAKQTIDEFTTKIK